MRIGALVEYAVFGVLWLFWKGGVLFGRSDDGRAFGLGAPVVMPDEFAPVVPVQPPGAAAAAVPEPQAPPEALVGHRRSKTLHRPTCRYAPPPDLAQPFPDLSSAEEAGFRPCKVCRAS